MGKTDSFIVLYVWCLSVIIVETLTIKFKH